MCARCVPLRAHLADQGKAVGVGVQRRLDELVGDFGAIEVGSVDVIDAEVGRAPQDRDGRITISRRAEHTWTRQLHRAEADAEHSYRSQNMTAWLHAAMVLPK